MPRRMLEVAVMPEILTWARKSMEIDVEKVARRCKVSRGTVLKWEAGQATPTLGTLKELAKLYKRPLAVFFLPKPPKELPLPKDFRVLPNQERGALSEKTRLALRSARRSQSLFKEMVIGTSRELATDIGKADLTDSAEVVARRERERLGVKMQEQFGWKSSREALARWRTVVEDVGILVFQSSMPIEDTRGFSLGDNGIRVIVLNSRDAVNARIFTLFHEYSHLLLGGSGICNLERESEEAWEAERFCNHFAGAFLVPKAELLNHELVRPIRPYSNIPDELLEEIALSFRVSKDVILRRMEIADLVSRSFYLRKFEKWTAERRSGAQMRRGFRVDPVRKCLADKGLSFVSLVLEARKKGVITYSDAIDYLSIKLKHLAQVERLTEGKT